MRHGFVRAVAVAFLVVWTSSGACVVKVSSGDGCPKEGAHAEGACDEGGAGHPPPADPLRGGGALVGYHRVPAQPPLAHPTGRLVPDDVRAAWRASGEREALRLSARALAHDPRLRLPAWAGVLLPGGATLHREGLRVTWYQLRAPLARVALPPGRVVFEFDREGRLLGVENATWIAP